MTQPTHTYFDVLKLAYYDDVFWRRLIAKPVHTLEDAGIILSEIDQEKLFSALRNFSLVFAFDKYRGTGQIPISMPPSDPPAFDDTGWDCRVPWGQT
jgi:hypothetical protein